MVTDSPEQNFLNQVLELVNFQMRYDSEYHGVQHWMRVERNGRWLASKDDLADELVIRAFALIHDSQREEDGEDEYHGPHAAKYVDKLQTIMGPDWILDVEQTYTLKRACNGHTAAHPDNYNELTLDPTVACCWDADRLDMGRVGVEPEAEYLFTADGRMLAATKGQYALSDMGILVTDQDNLTPTINPEDLR